jgi:RsiW-degrading membrane proteinase PrsW (M82 family)
MQPWLAVAGALPAIGAMAYVDHLDAKRPEPRWSLRRVALLGALSVVPCVILEELLMRIHVGGPWASVLFKAFVVAAAVEELAKVCVVRWAIWNRPEFDERLDGIVYATRAGLGFALVENVAYLLGPKTAGAFVIMYLVRALLAVPGHAIYAGFMGYFAARRRFDNAGPGLLGGYLIAVVLHGTYDASLFALPLVAQANKALLLPLMIIPVAVVAIGGVALRRRARLALELDDRAEAQAQAAAAAAAQVA